jgi:hypothetical protein
MRPTCFEVEETRSDELRDLVCGNPSLFGRLVAVSTLRDISPEGLTARYAPSEIQQTLRELHLDIFVSWLNLSLKQQKADLAIYLARIGARPIALSGLLARIQTLVPPDADQSQRNLFLEDMAVAYALFCPEWDREPAVAAPSAGEGDARAA